MDVVIAFLYRFFNKIIYIEQLHLFEFNFENICQLHKALYRLKQAPQVQYKAFANFLKKLGLEHLKLDYDVFILKD